MARIARLLCFLLVTVFILANVESKTTRSVHHRSTTSHSNHKPISKPISAPISRHERGTSRHTYPHSGGGSGSGRQVTNAPRVAYQPYEKPKSTFGTHSYPQSFGGSGGTSQVTATPARQINFQPIQQPTSGTHSYPSSNGGSGGGRTVTTAPGYTPYPHPKPTTASHSYPSSVGGSGSGRTVTVAPMVGYTPYPQPKPTTASHTYPASHGGSGGGFNANSHSSIGVYPHNTNTGILGSMNFNTGHTGFNAAHSGYNSHVFMRNQQTNIYTSNIRTNHIHHYHYNPPQKFYYSGYSSQAMYYPVYTGQLPDYVFEYRASRSRYSKLLAGLALYNLGLASRNHQVQAYHKLYQQRSDELCQFGVYYNILRNEEMEIDCRLMTEFIWSESQNIRPGVVIGNQIFLSNGTLISSSTQFVTTGIVNALDPKFNGDYVHVTSNMKCYIKWTVTWTYPRRKDVDCGLLQSYVERSLNSANKVKSVLLMIVTSVLVILFH